MGKKKLHKIGHLQQRRPILMLEQTQINQIRTYSAKGFAIKRISKLMGIARNTVRKYLSDRSMDSKPDLLAANSELIYRLFLQSEGNCVVVRRNLLNEHGIKIHIRQLQRFCETFRRQLKETTRTIRYETQPGEQMQIDFGERDVSIDDTPVRVHFFVAVLAFSRRIFVKAYPAENQAAWLNGIESAFFHFNGVPRSIVCDNSKCLVTEHRNGLTKLTAGFETFCHYWNTRVIACTPYHPQCKGKCERAVRYIKENALVGRNYKDIEELNDWLITWCLSEADNRKLDQTVPGLRIPKERFMLESKELQPLNKVRIAQIREETRHVDRTGLIRIDNRFYRVPDDVKDLDVQILIDEQSIVVSRRGLFVVELDKVKSVYHLKQQPPEGVHRASALPAIDPRYSKNPLQRDLSSYQSVTGGATW